MKSALYFKSFLFIFFTTYCFQMKAQNDMWHMVKYISDSMPVHESRRELCKTEEGREIIISTLDTINLRDMMFQWEGIRFQDSNYKVTLHDFLLLEAERMCTPIPGGQVGYIQDTNKMVFYDKNIYWCTSANTGGGTKYDCNEKYDLVLPDGWQVCRLFYDKSYRRHGKHRFYPIYLPNDNQNPKRYIGHTLHLTGHGDEGNPSKIKISNIKVYAIRANLDNAYRKSCNCEMVVVSTPITIHSKPPKNSEPIAEILITGKGNGAFLQNVSIKNRTNKNIEVTFKRTSELDGKYSTRTIQMNASATEFIGYSCHTAFASDLCDVYYRTEILSAKVIN